jgi:hypothetical protein
VRTETVIELRFQRGTSVSRIEPPETVEKLRLSVVNVHIDTNGGRVSRECMVVHGFSVVVDPSQAARQVMVMVSVPPEGDAAATEVRIFPQAEESLMAACRAGTNLMRFMGFGGGCRGGGANEYCDSCGKGDHG